MHKLIDLKDITTVYEFVRLKHPSWILGRVYRRLWLFTQRSSSRTSLFTKKSRVGTVQWWVRWIQSFYSWCRIWTGSFRGYLKTVHDHDVTCVVCLVCQRSVVQMFPVLYKKWNQYVFCGYGAPSFYFFDIFSFWSLKLNKLFWYQHFRYSQKGRILVF